MNQRIDADYSPAVTTASKSVLLELMTILGEYRESLVLIGGWAPYFLLDQGTDSASAGGFGTRPFHHVGSIDIDLGINLEEITGEEYKTIVRLLKERGYAPDPEIKYRLNRTVPGLASPIGVDFLTTHPPLGQGRSHRHRIVQDDLPARTTAYLEMAFQWNQPLQLEGNLPEDGGHVSVTFKLAALHAMVGLKGLALGERYKEKDAYDIYALVRYYGSSIAAVVDILNPHAQQNGLKKGLQNIREKFKSDRDAGPVWVANFLTMATPEEKALIVQDAFQTMDKVLKECGF